MYRTAVSSNFTVQSFAIMIMRLREWMFCKFYETINSIIEVDVVVIIVITLMLCSMMLSSEGNVEINI